MDLKVVETVLQILASPVVIAVIGWLYFRMTKKKVDAELIQHLFEKALTIVKTLEKDLVSIPGDIDARMKKALEIYNDLKIQLPFKLAAESLGIDFNKLKPEDVQDLFEKILHASKLGLNFNIIAEIKNKLDFGK